LKAFSYAQAAAGAVEMAVVRQDGCHITQNAFDQLQVELTRLYVADINNDMWVPSVDQWKYTLTYATVAFTCERSRAKITAAIEAKGFRVETIETLRETRRPVTILSGLVNGPTAALSEETFATILKREALTKGIAGRLEVINVITTTSHNAILRIRADDVAMERLKELSFTLNIALAGRVLFECVKSGELTKDNRSTSSPTPGEGADTVKERLKKLLEEMERVKAELEAYVEAKASDETGSVASLGLSGLNVVAEEGKEMLELIEEINECEMPDPSGTTSEETSKANEEAELEKLMD
jgi:hypothetical protein